MGFNKMPSAHCICPGFFASHISDPLVFNNIFLGILLQSDDQVITDKNGRLKLEYGKAVEHDQNAFGLYKIWINQLEARKDGKLLRTPVVFSPSVEKTVFESINKAATTFDKNILTSDNERYSPFIEEMQRQRISLFNLQNLTPNTVYKLSQRNISFEELSYDIAWILHRLARTNSKGTTEDDYNDHLRNLLLSSKYEVKDQTREGQSSSGISAGELDLVIEEKGFLFSIIEAMILTSVDSNYIDKHYKKVVNNYNPLGVNKTFLITYYSGNEFEKWWVRYCTYISEYDVDKFDIQGEVTLYKTDVEATLYPNLKKLTQHFYINGEHNFCVHYAIRF